MRGQLGSWGVWGRWGWRSPKGIRDGRNNERSRRIQDAHDLNISIVCPLKSLEKNYNGRSAAIAEVINRGISAIGKLLLQDIVGIDACLKQQTADSVFGNLSLHIGPINGDARGHMQTCMIDRIRNDRVAPLTEGRNNEI